MVEMEAMMEAMAVDRVEAEAMVAVARMEMMAAMEMEEVEAMMEVVEMVQMVVQVEAMVQMVTQVPVATTATDSTTCSSSTTLTKLFFKLLKPLLWRARDCLDGASLLPELLVLSEWESPFSLQTRGSFWMRTLFQELH